MDLGPRDAGRFHLKTLIITPAKTLVPTEVASRLRFGGGHSGAQCTLQTVPLMGASQADMHTQPRVTAYP